MCNVCLKEQTQRHNFLIPTAIHARWVIGSLEESPFYEIFQSKALPVSQVTWEIERKIL